MQHQDTLFYVSLKGVILLDRKVLLLRKPSGEWDLPGGRLGATESLKQCLVREVQEETGLIVEPGKLLHRWLRRRPGKIDVFVVSHLCRSTGAEPELLISKEHEEYDWFSSRDVAMLITSRGVRKSVQRAFRLLK